MGSNGIIGRATSAVMEHKKATAKEVVEMKIIEITQKSYTTNYRKPTLKDIAEELNADTEIFRIIECDSKTNFDAIPDDVNNIKVIYKKYEDIQLEVLENNGEFKVSVVGEEEKVDEPVAIIPEINGLEIEEVTTNSFKVTVDATNAVSFDYTIDAEGETEYPKEYTEESNAYYTFTGLKTGVDYTISVVATSSDGSKSYTHQTIGRPTEMPTPNITFTPSVQGWTREVTITASTSQTGYTLKTSKDGENYTTDVSQTFKTNGTMYAILTDGVNETAVATQVVSTIDRTNPNAPTLTPSGTKQENDYTSDVTITITANGDEIGEVDHIEYTITGAQTGSSNNFTSGSTVTINALGTSTITAEVVDKAGNKSTAETLVVKKVQPTYTITYNSNGGSVSPTSQTGVAGSSITMPTPTKSGMYFGGWFTSATGGTKREYTTMPSASETVYAHWLTELEYTLGYVGNTNSNNLVVGDHINYYYANGTDPIECVVLYNDSTYGIQVVSADTVGSDITLGVDEDFEATKTSYNNAVSTLNAVAMNYVKTTEPRMATGGRCIGSNPAIGQKNDIEASSGYYTGTQSWFSSYNNTFKNGDELYNTDYNAMKNMRTPIHILGKSYWLASRFTEGARNNNDFVASVRFVDSEGDVNDYGMYIDIYGAKETQREVYGGSIDYRPCFYLKSDIPVEKLN